MSQHETISQQTYKMCFSDIFTDVWSAVDKQASQALSDMVWDRCDSHIPMCEIGWSIDERVCQTFNGVAST